MSLRSTPIAIPAGIGQTQEILVDGDTLFCYDASAEFAVQVENGPTFPMERGIKYKIGGKIVRLVNISANAVTGRMLVGLGQEVDDYRSTYKAQIASVGARLYSGLCPVAWTQVANQNLNRVELIAQAGGGNVAVFYLSSSNGAANQICWLRPTENFRINFTGPIWISGNGTDTCTITETSYQ